MRQCPRCYRWHRGIDTEVCIPCWEQMGQMTFWQEHSDEIDDDDLPVPPRYWRESVVPNDPDEEGYEPPMDTFFDREEEARGWL